MSDQEAVVHLPVAQCQTETRLRITQVNHLWTIQHLGFLLEKERLTSLTFGADGIDGIRWYLELYPKGSDESNKDYISISLRTSQCGEDGVVAKYKISILNMKDGPSPATSGYQPKRFTSDVGWGSDTFIHRDSLLANPESYAPGDTLTILCEISYAVDTAVVVTNFTRNERDGSVGDVGNKLSGLTARLREIEVSASERRMYSDVVLELNGREFYAHKAVLGARSPVFKTIFEQFIGESTMTRLEMCDMDENTLEDLLQFIYTGEAEDVEKVSSLLSSIYLYVMMKNPAEESRVIPTTEPRKDDSTGTEMILDSASSSLETHLQAIEESSDEDYRPPPTESSDDCFPPTESSDDWSSPWKETQTPELTESSDDELRPTPTVIDLSFAGIDHAEMSRELNSFHNSSMRNIVKRRLQRLRPTNNLFAPDNRDVSYVLGKVPRVRLAASTESFITPDERSDGDATESPALSTRDSPVNALPRDVQRFWD